MFPKRSKSVSSSSGVTVIENILEKKKTIGSGRFYCALRDGKLWYSEDKARESLIDIAHAQSIREGKAKFSFEIITSSRTHVFIADSQATRDKWISCLREVMRTSLRKPSTDSYVAADENNQSIASRSSLALRSLASPKPGFASTLPASLATKTPPKSSENEHKLRKSSNTDAAPQSESPDEMKPGPKAFGLAPVSETSEVRTVLLRRDVKNNAEKINNLSSDIRAERESLDSDVNDYESVIQTDFQVKQFVEASQNDGNNDQIGSSLMLKLDEEEDNSYANRADIEKFLNEQRSAAEGMSPGSTDASDTKISEFSPQSESQKSNSAEVETATGISESTEVCNSSDENSDEVFPLTGQNNQKVIESSPGPVMRRSTQSTPSIEVDYAAPALTEVELDLDFASGPIPSLPHPCLEEKWSLAFLDIRSMLSDKTKDDSFTSSIQPGCAIEALKSFLNSLNNISHV